MKQVVCRCSAYKFPHRRHGGKCNSCNHGKNWVGIAEHLEYNNGEWCEQCAQREVEDGGRNWNRFLLDQFI